MAVVTFNHERQQYIHAGWILQPLRLTIRCLYEQRDALRPPPVILLSCRSEAVTRLPWLSEAEAKGVHHFRKLNTEICPTRANKALPFGCAHIRRFWALPGTRRLARGNVAT